jgi:NADH:ubiquinone oxidoreductase subunit F (NADH-binding)
LPELVPADIAASIAEKGCAVDLARFSMIVSADNQTCTKCSSCRLGVAQALTLLNDIAAGRGTFEMLGLLEELAETIELASDCPVGKSAPSILRFTLNHFRDQFEAHIQDKCCPAGVCREQIAYAATCSLKTEASQRLGGAEP